MGRMLEALKRIETKAPSPPAIRPLSPEDLEAFGFRQSHPAVATEPRPAAPSDEKPRESETHASAQDGETSVPEVPASPSGDDRQAPQSFSEPLPTARRGRIPEAEIREYRSLAENVLSQLPAGRSSVLMLTSPGDGEGKTATLIGLAAALADRMTDGVVAVDCDFRSPELARRTGVPSDRGVVDVLLGGAAWDEAVRQSPLAPLDVLPGGRFPAADGLPPDDLSLTELLEPLRGRYGLVLLDTSSLRYPEAARLAEFCDGTYLVLRSGQTTRNAARQAVAQIESCGGRVLGCVLNGPATGPGGPAGW